MDQSQEDGYRTRFRGWKWIYDTFESGGIRSIYWPKRSLYYQSASYKDCIQTLTCHHFSWELNVWSMGGPVQEAYVVMRLDLTEIACTPAIGSWTLTTRGTIFKWQPPESWTNFTRPRKWNDWYKSTIPEQNAQPSYLAAVTVQKESWWIFYLGVTSPGKACPDD